MLKFCFTATLTILFIGGRGIDGCKVEKPEIKLMGTDSLFKSGARPRLISSEFSFTEGPAADRLGNIYFTDQPNDRIWKYAADGTLSVFMHGTGRSNGMYFDPNGNLISCADENNELWSISPDKTVAVLVSAVNGQKMNGPNDVWANHNGDLYFTDPLYERPYWKTPVDRVDGQHVYLLRRGAKQPVIVDDDLVKPNGIVGTAGGKTLYVADIEADKTYRYDINGDGSLANRRLFAPQGSDGMTLDEKGNLYLTGKGVTVYSSAGEKLAHIDVPEGWTANVCFGGVDHKNLFITASKSVYIVEMNVRGIR